MTNTKYECLTGVLPLSIPVGWVLTSKPLLIHGQSTLLSVLNSLLLLIIAH